jgi:transaldolase/glucose-6-phosphate isomerase
VRGLEASRVPNGWADVVQTLTRGQVVARLWGGDPTLWKGDPDGIASRLGWLHSHETMLPALPILRAFRDEARSSGLRRAIVLGMGGASLIAETFSRSFRGAVDSLSVEVLDSTHPQAVRACTNELDPLRTLFIVSSKSGTTVETLALFRHFHDVVVRSLGAREAGAHFVAVTDPGTSLVALAEKHQFRRVFLNDPTLGGRYSALSYVGLLPASLRGVDLDLLLRQARRMAERCCLAVCDPDNPGLWLGGLLGGFAREGRDKLTFVFSPRIAGLGPWLEQLIAESTGKDGKGILPVVGESLGSPDVYGNDRVFVHLCLRNDASGDERLAALADAGHPVIRINVGDLGGLAGQLFLWQFATAVASHVLGVNPFDQPNVELSKRRAKEVIAEQRTRQAACEETPALSCAALLAAVARAKPGGYIALHAYLAPNPETSEALADLQAALRDKTRLAVTVGYGPRFLHSTGQLHKGDEGNGVFLQLLGMTGEDVPIPGDEPSHSPGMTFGILLRAQAVGDARALTENGRAMTTFAVGENLAHELRQLTGLL